MMNGMKKIGFTGTSRGTSARQRQSLTFIFEILREGKPSAALELHHGDCVGADAEAHTIALELGIAVVIHPPEDTKARAFCGDATASRDPKPYLVRNHAIVDETEFLIACPATYVEHLRSGTWATYRYALRLGRRIILITPDGKVVWDAV